MVFPLKLISSSLFSIVFSEPYEPKPVLNAALTVVRGHTASMDMVRVETKSQVMLILSQLLF